MGGFRTSLSMSLKRKDCVFLLVLKGNDYEIPMAVMEPSQSRAPQSPKGPISRRSSHTTERCPKSLKVWKNDCPVPCHLHIDEHGFPLRLRNLKGIGAWAITTQSKTCQACCVSKPVVPNSLHTTPVTIFHSEGGPDWKHPTDTRPPIMEEMKTTALEEPFSIFGRSCWANHAPCFAPDVHAGVTLTPLNWRSCTE